MAKEEATSGRCHCWAGNGCQVSHADRCPGTDTGVRMQLRSAEAEQTLLALEESVGPSADGDARAAVEDVLQASRASWRQRGAGPRALLAVCSPGPGMESL